MNLMVDSVNNMIVTLSTRFDDKRINSIEDELIIKEALIKVCEKHKIKYHNPTTRFWYDFGIFQGDTLMPINIKVSACKSADNSVSKKAIYYALTGIIDSKIERNQEFFASLKNNMKDTNKDYYFIIIDKNNGKAFHTSLKQLQYLTPNGNNPPFQINWNKNKTRSVKTFVQVCNMVMGTYKRTLDLSIKPYQKFVEVFGNTYDC